MCVCVSARCDDDDEGGGGGGWMGTLLRVAQCKS